MIVTEKSVNVNLCFVSFVEQISTPKQIWLTIGLDGMRPLVMAQSNISFRFTVPDRTVDFATSEMTFASPSL